MVQQTWTHMIKHYYSVWFPSHATDAYLNFKNIYSFPKSILHAHIKLKKKNKQNI